MTEWDASDAQLELRLRTWAIPAALLVGFFLVAIVPSLVRIFFSMWVHEIGHAATAWMCGYLAFPGPWLTPTASRQSLFFELLVLGGLAAGAVWAFRQERPVLGRSLIAVAAVQLGCAALLGPSRARQLIVFMGDGGCLVIGTLLMLSIYTRAASQGWLRWGFLGIGAAAFADAFSLWWGARTDADRIPFGMNEGAGLSDPSVLSEGFGWSAGMLVHRYVALGVVCLAVLAVSWYLGRRRA
ncbi:MAG: hypothetical protein ABR567_08410 [Myxococcales bacterium]|nr:hypothetical protein [Myxococcales bacterium]